MRSKYTLYKRDSSPYYQVQFLNDDGTQGIQKSSGKKNKAEAARWADEQLSSGKIALKKEVKFLTLDDIGLGFFDYQSPWAQNRINSGYRLSEQQCLIKQKLYDNHISPRIGSCKLTDLDNTTLDRVRESLLQSKTLTTGKPLTGSTINKALSVLTAIIEYADRKEYIKRPPSIQRVSPRLHRKERIVLPHNEVISLFADITNWQYVRPKSRAGKSVNPEKAHRYSNDEIDPDNLRAYTVCYLAWKTGMRESEIQGLTQADIEFTPTGESLISITKAWNKMFRRINVTTKTGKIGVVPLDRRGTALIKKVIELNPYPESSTRFVFFGKTQDAPITRESIRRPLQAALKNVLNKTGFTIHCFRHQANSSYLAAGLSGERTRLFLRHDTIDMTLNYSHDVGEYKDVLEAQGRMDRPSE